MLPHSSTCVSKVFKTVLSPIRLNGSTAFFWGSKNNGSHRLIPTPFNSKALFVKRLLI